MKTLLTALCTAAIILPACDSTTAASPSAAKMMMSAKICRDSRGRFTKCPAPAPAPTQTCPDGTVIPVTGTCPALPPEPTPTPTPVPVEGVYDAAIGMGVDVDGFAALPLRTGAHRYFVNGATGSDANGCGGSYTAPLKTVVAGMACIADNYAGGSLGDQLLIAEGTQYAEALPWLAFKWGYSAQYPAVIESYDPADPTNEAKYGRGDQRGARPVLTARQGQITSGRGPRFLVIRGLDFNPGNVSDTGLNFVAVDNDAANSASFILIENNLFRYTGLSFDIGPAPTLRVGQHLIIRNNSLYGPWSTGGRTGGVYIAGVDSPTIEDNVFYHCGWKIGANRNDATSVGGATYFSHSYYLQTSTTNAIVRRNLSADGAGDGGIARGDSVFTENIFIDNPASIGVGGGPTYNVDRPTGVSFDVSYNAIIGSSAVANGASGWGINTTNGKAGSRVHHNLLVRSANPLDSNGSGFSNNAAFDQPSYAQFDHNLMFQWVAPTGQVYWPSCGAFPAQCHTTYDSNVWDGVALGTNTSSESTVFPRPYTQVELYAALGFADKAAFINYAIAHPEAHIQRNARALLFTGYAVP